MLHLLHLLVVGEVNLIKIDLSPRQSSRDSAVYHLSLKMQDYKHVRRFHVVNIQFNFFDLNVSVCHARSFNPPDPIDITK